MMLTKTNAAESRMDVSARAGRVALVSVSGRSVHAFVMVGVALVALASLAPSQSVVTWGDDSYGQCDVPGGLSYVKVAGGSQHTVALRSDGAVLAWGLNTSGQCNVPVQPTGLSNIGVAAGSAHTVVLRSNGSAIAWGDNTFGQCIVPGLPTGLTYVEVAAGNQHTVALLSDGSVVAWGDNGSGQCNVLPPPSGQTYVGVAAGEHHTVARRSDGAVVAWGTIRSANVTFRRFRAPLPTFRSRRAINIRWRSGATAPSLHGGTTHSASATFRPSRSQ